MCAVQRKGEKSPRLGEFPLTNDKLFTDCFNYAILAVFKPTEWYICIMIYHNVDMLIHNQQFLVTFPWDHLD